MRTKSQFMGRKSQLVSYQVVTNANDLAVIFCGFILHDWSQNNNKHFRNFLRCSQFDRKDCIKLFLLMLSVNVCLMLMNGRSYHEIRWVLIIINNLHVLKIALPLWNKSFSAFANGCINVWKCGLEVPNQRPANRRYFL